MPSSAWQWGKGVNGGGLGNTLQKHAQFNLSPGKMHTFPSMWQTSALLDCACSRNVETNKQNLEAAH